MRILAYFATPIMVATKMQMTTMTANSSTSVKARKDFRPETLDFRLSRFVPAPRKTLREVCGGPRLVGLGLRPTTSCHAIVRAICKPTDLRRRVLQEPLSPFDFRPSEVVVSGALMRIIPNWIRNSRRDPADSHLPACHAPSVVAHGTELDEVRFSATTLLTATAFSWHANNSASVNPIRLINGGPRRPEPTTVGRVGFYAT